ncbi:MAG: ABC transporter permease [Deltaproteobacteria bacterium]|nr:MAG: ABC transporter permease [Deltaproteobacteria bacterium]
MASFWKIRRSQGFRAALLTLPSALFIFFFMILPLITIVIYSFWRTKSYTMIPDWNLNNYATVLGQKTYLTFLWRSFIMAVSVTAISLIYSYPVAYFIAKRGGRYRLILVLLTAAPFFTGIILRVTAMQQILGPIGLINMALTQLGFEPIHIFMYTPFATGIGLIYLWIPFMVLAIYLSLLNFNFELLEVANVNGAKPWRAFFEITWPLNWMGTAIGIALVFIPTFSAAITPRFLGGVNGAMFGNILEHEFGATGTWALGSAMGVIMFLICMLVIVAVWKTINLKRSGYTGTLIGEQE